MAVQIDAPGQVQEFLAILTRRKWQIILPALTFLSVGIAVGVVIPKKYLVTTQVELREIFLGDVSAKAAAAQTQGIAENAPQQIQSPKRITEVLEQLKWPEYLTLSNIDKVDFRSKVRSDVSVQVPPVSKDAGSAFVAISYRNVDKDYAQEFLKALRQAWIEQVVERQRQRYDLEYRKLLERRNELEKDYAKETRLRTDLRSENTISPTQPTPGANQARIEDANVVRFEDNLDRMDEVTLELQTAREALTVVQEQLADTDPEIPKTKIIEGQSFAAQIETARGRQRTLENQLDGIRPAHPRYRLIQRELEQIDEEIRGLEMQQTSSEVSQEFERNPAYTRLENLAKEYELQIGRMSAEQNALRLALEDNKRDLRRLNEAYMEDSAHSERIEAITLALQEVEVDLVRKKQRRDVVYGPSGNPFQIVQEVEEPGEPTEPNPFIIIAAGLVLGMAVGFGSSIAMEFSKSCFRSTSDISRVMVAPVLGVIGPIVTRRDKRRRRLRRFVVGSLSLMLIGSILFVTWAWTTEPDLLGAALNDSIEEFRALFV